MVENIGGIKGDGPAYKQILIEPHPGGRLTQAETSYQSIRGQIATSWIKEGETLSLNATIPANTTASVILPASGPEAISENGRPLDQSEGVKVVSSAGDRTVLKVGSGRYTFVTRTK
jgi:alpha-L-rhamnosidase